MSIERKCAVCDHAEGDHIAVDVGHKFAAKEEATVSERKYDVEMAPVWYDEDYDTKRDPVRYCYASDVLAMRDKAQDVIDAWKMRAEKAEKLLAGYNTGGFADSDSVMNKYLDLLGELAAEREKTAELRSALQDTCLLISTSAMYADGSLRAAMAVAASALIEPKEGGAK